MHLSAYILYFNGKFKSSGLQTCGSIWAHRGRIFHLLHEATQSEILKAKWTARYINHLTSSVGKFSGLLWSFFSSLQCHCKCCQDTDGGCCEWHTGEGEQWVRHTMWHSRQHLPSDKAAWVNEPMATEVFSSSRFDVLMEESALSLRNTKGSWGENLFLPNSSVHLINHLRNKIENKARIMTPNWQSFTLPSQIFLGNIGMLLQKDSLMGIHQFLTFLPTTAFL